MEQHTPNDRNLRSVLTVNAATSGLGGAVAVVAAGPLDELLGTGQTMWVRIVGAGLVAFAAFVLLVARGNAGLLHRETPMISVGDAAWVIGTVVTIALGWYSTAGAVAMALVGAMVATFAVLQLCLLPRRTRDLAAA